MEPEVTEPEGGSVRAGTTDEFSSTDTIRLVHSFDSMQLKEDLLRGIYAYGFEKPSAIQQRAVLPILEGRDVIAQAQSGTGKTSLVALCICQLVDVSKRDVQALVLSPTRELAAQTEKMTLALGDFLNVQVRNLSLSSYFSLTLSANRLIAWSAFWLARMLLISLALLFFYLFSSLCASWDDTICISETFLLLHHTLPPLLISV